MLAGIALATLLPGCVSFSDAPDDVDFAGITSLHDFDGRYANHPDGSGPELSTLIWGRHRTHPAADTIEVRALDEDTLEVKALRDGVVERTGRFHEGDDFEIDDGRIVLKRGLDTYPTSERRDMRFFLGIGYEHRSVGLDERGDGKFRDDVTAMGLLGVIPLAGHGRRDVRYRRLGDLERPPDPNEGTALE